MASLDLLVICTGNVCRSAALQMMLRGGFGGVPGWTEPTRVASAGTHALTGRPIDPSTAHALSRLGVPVDPSFVARQVTAELVVSANLVLTAKREQRAVVARVAPEAVSRLFTMREFLRFGRGPEAEVLASRHADSSEEHWTSLVRLAARSRSSIRPRRPDEDDISDPYGRALRVHRRVGTELAGVATTLLRLGER